MAGEIAELMARLVRAWNAHDVEAIAACYAPDYVGVDVAQATPLHGSHGARSAAVRYLRAFPDLQFSGDWLIQDTRVALIWTLRGTHQGRLLRIPPSDPAQRSGDHDPRGFGADGARRPDHRGRFRLGCGWIPACDWPASRIVTARQWAMELTQPRWFP
jgi:predicted ester cyclase